MRLASILAFAVPFAACAFSVQVSLTGRDSGGEWFSMSAERSGGAFGGYWGGRTLFFDHGEMYDGHQVGAMIMFPIDMINDNAEGKIKIAPAYLDGSIPSMGGWYQSDPSVSVDLSDAEAYPFGTFNFAWGNAVWSNCVLTVRGNPYSLIVNNTATARTINGVEIDAFAGKELLFPLILYMTYDANLSFYDLDSGLPLAAEYKSSRYYSLMWAGNIELRDGSAPSAIPAATNLDQIVYADVKGGNTVDKVLYAENGRPVYAGVVSISTNIQLCTWWEFAQGEWGNPQAKINGEVVCGNHSTDHLIAYTVNTGTIHASEMSGKASFTFTMSQSPESGYAGGACVFKCWDAESGATKEGYAATPDAHRAAISGNTSTIATFRVTINKYTGDWTVEPVN